MPNDYLTVPQAAALLHTREGTIRRWCQTGTLPATKQGRDWLIRRRDIKGFTPPTGRGWGAYWRKRGQT